MTYGPIDFLALEFEGNKFKGEILASLLELVENNIVRIIDMVVIVKDADGVVTPLEMQQLDAETLAILDPLRVHASGLVSTQDIDNIAAALSPNTSAGILLFENLWAIRFVEAVLEADGRLILQERIPREIVDEALADLAGM